MLLTHSGVRGSGVAANASAPSSHKLANPAPTFSHAVLGSSGSSAATGRVSSGGALLRLRRVAAWLQSSSKASHPTGDSRTVLRSNGSWPK
eukprot:560863-Rhodomonas_salina.2